MVEVIVKDEDLQQAALEGMDEFLDVFVKAIYDAIGGELTAESMAKLNADQLTLLAWNILHEEVMDGGFVQLIYNGYGPFIFKNPLAKALRQWDMRAPSKLIYDAHTLWLKYREEIETEKSDEDFMAMFEQYPEFENLDDIFIENEEEWTEDIALQIRNKKASFEYFFVETYTAGIVLTGTEIKSIRLGKASLVDTYCVVLNGELWVKGMNVSPYFYGSYNNHEAKRDRKLLLTKKEIRALESATKQTGFTIVPTLVFIDDKGRAKVDVALCKGKKEFDKRQTLKEKEDRREMDRAMKVWK